MISGMSAIGTKRTSACALHMSAFDPKRTFGGDGHPFRGLAWSSTMRRVGRGHAAAKIHFALVGGAVALAVCAQQNERTWRLIWRI
jgi:hypothetical protein